jgi:hypothetical protein
MKGTVGRMDDVGLLTFFPALLIITDIWTNKQIPAELSYCVLLTPPRVAFLTSKHNSVDLPITISGKYTHIQTK